MKIHDEERDIYGTVYVQGKKYFLLENKPAWFRKPSWIHDDSYWWMVAEDDAKTENDITTGRITKVYYVASFISFDSSALIDLLPVPLTKKVIRFYITDDEEA